MKSVYCSLLASLISMSIVHPLYAGPWIQINGYIKPLGIIRAGDKPETLNSTNLWHNRINLKIRPISSLTLAVECRNRLFVGEELRENMWVADQLDRDEGIVDLSFVWAKRYPLLGHSRMERLYIDWQQNRWELRIGRQRINWGMNLSWNPNDLFNTYNFLDFDYEERAGSDAVKLTYQINAFHVIEGAFSPSRNPQQFVGAFRLGGNYKGYDWQVIGGLYKRDIVIGIGWAGSIGEAGFKGECSYFQDWGDCRFQQVTLSATMTADYAFSGGWYLMASVLYNNRAEDRLSGAGGLLQRDITPRVLMPAKYSLLLQAVKQFNPALSGGVSVLYSPRINLLLISPTISYAVVNNWEIDLTGQHFFAGERASNFGSLGHVVTLRTRWSFGN